MARKIKEETRLNNRQKAVLKLATYTDKLDDIDLTNWKEIYLLANSDDYLYTLNLKSFQNLVSKFKNAKATQEFYQHELAERKRETLKQKSETIETYIHETDNIKLNENEKIEDLTEYEKALRCGQNSDIDYKDKKNLLLLLNQMLNRTKSDSDKIPIIKQLIDICQFKQESDKKDLQRFYLPLTCHNCKLYKDAGNQQEMP